MLRLSMRIEGLRAALMMAAVLLVGACSSGLISNAPEAPDPYAISSAANLASLTDVVTRNPNDPQAYNMRGSVYGQTGFHKEALEDFNRAISLDPKFAQAYANRGLVHRQINRLELALADYNRALAIDPNYASAFLGRGVVHRQRGQLVNALNDFNKTIAIRPDNAQAYYNRGLLYQNQRQHQFAIDDFSTAITLNPMPEALIARALSYLAVNNIQSAATDLDEAVQANPANLQGWVARGLAYERLNNRERAAGSYARALVLQRDHAAAKAGFARVGGVYGKQYQTF